MPRLTDPQLATVIKGSPFPQEQWVTAMAVALAESGGVTDARNHNWNGTWDYGLFQINTIHQDILHKGEWSDPEDNAVMAWAVYSQAYGWRPWVAFTTGRYRIFLPRAEAAMKAQVAPPPTDPNDHSGVTGFIDAVTDGHTWMRFGMALGGAGLLLLAVVKMSGVRGVVQATPIGQTLKSLKIGG